MTTLGLIELSQTLNRYINENRSTEFLIMIHAIKEDLDITNIPARHIYTDTAYRLISYLYYRNNINLENVNSLRYMEYILDEFIDDESQLIDLTRIIILDDIPIYQILFDRLNPNLEENPSIVNLFFFAIIYGKSNVITELTNKFDIDPLTSGMDPLKQDGKPASDLNPTNGIELAIRLFWLKMNRRCIFMNLVNPNDGHSEGNLVLSISERKLILTQLINLIPFDERLFQLIRYESRLTAIDSDLVNPLRQNSDLIPRLNWRQIVSPHMLRIRERISQQSDDTSELDFQRILETESFQSWEISEMLFMSIISGGLQSMLMLLGHFPELHQYISNPVPHYGEVRLFYNYSSNQSAIYLAIDSYVLHNWFKVYPEFDHVTKLDRLNIIRNLLSRISSTRIIESYRARHPRLFRRIETLQQADSSSDSEQSDMEESSNDDVIDNVSNWDNNFGLWLEDIQPAVYQFTPSDRHWERGQPYLATFVRIVDQHLQQFGINYTIQVSGEIGADFSGVYRDVVSDMLTYWFPVFDLKVDENIGYQINVPRFSALEKVGVSPFEFGQVVGYLAYLRRSNPLINEVPLNLVLGLEFDDFFYQSYLGKLNDNEPLFIYLNYLDPIARAALRTRLSHETLIDHQPSQLFNSIMTIVTEACTSFQMLLDLLMDNPLELYVMHQLLIQPCEYQDLEPAEKEQLARFLPSATVLNMIEKDYWMKLFEIYDNMYYYQNTYQEFYYGINTVLAEKNINKTDFRNLIKSDGFNETTLANGIIARTTLQLNEDLNDNHQIYFNRFAQALQQLNYRELRSLLKFWTGHHQLSAPLTIDLSNNTVITSSTCFNVLHIPIHLLITDTPDELITQLHNSIANASGMGLV